MGGTHPEMLDKMYKQLKVWRQHFKVSYHLLRKKKTCWSRLPHGDKVLFCAVAHCSIGHLRKKNKYYIQNCVIYVMLSYLAIISYKFFSISKKDPAGLSEGQG